MKKATQQQTKEHNRNLVLRMLFEHDRISRAEIARRTTLTRTTVSEIVGDQIQEGLVREVGIGSSLGGKSPIMLSLVADARHVIGVDLAHDRFTGAVVDLRGRIIQAEEQPVPPRDGDAAVAAIYALLDKLVKAARTPIMGIGIGTPGLVDALSGVVVSAVDFGWHGLPLRRLIETRYHVPVSVLNDSQAAAMGEYTYGGVHAARSNLVVINVRYGIGAGIILNGEIFHGDGGGRERSGTWSWCARAARPATAATWDAWRRWPAPTPSSSARAPWRATRRARSWPVPPRTSTSTPFSAPSPPATLSRDRSCSRPAASWAWPSPAWWGRSTSGASFSPAT